MGDISDLIVIAGMLAVFMFALAVGLEMAFTLCLAAFIGLLLLRVDLMSVVGNIVWHASSSYTFSAVPLFIFMAELIASTKVAGDLYEAVSLWLSKVPGSLAVANVISCGIFAAISGSSLATAAAIGNVGIPEMKRRKYSMRLATGSVACAGTLGILIPPSIPFVIYGATTETSVGKLFMAGVIPGILIIMMYTIYIIVACVRDPHLAPAPVSTPWRHRFQTLPRTLPFVLLIASVLGVIYSGIATPTEAAGVGAFFALLLTLVRRELNMSNLRRALGTTIKVTCMVMFIVIGASALSYALTLAGMQLMLSNLVAFLNLPGWAFVSGICLLYLIAGCFFDVVSVMLITMPIIVPVLLGFGYDLIWFGVLFVILNELGLITPPFANNLFVIQSVSGVDMKEVISGALPFIILMIIALAIIVAFPQISLWLPSRMLR